MATGSRREQELGSGQLKVREITRSTTRPSCTTPEARRGTWPTLGKQMILPYSRGRLEHITNYLSEAKATYDLVLLVVAGKAIAACDIFLTETEFLNNLQYHFENYNFKPDIAFLRRLETLGFLPHGGLLSSGRYLSRVPKFIDPRPDVLKPEDFELLYKRYDDIIKCHQQKRLLFEGAIDLAGLAPNSMSSSFITKYQESFPIRIYLYTQIRELEKFFFLTAHRFLNGISFYEEKVAEFEKLVYAQNSLEPTFQDFLEKNYWIWGFEYIEAIPKRQLGGKHEIDFLLKRIDGKWEIVEIERSNLRLFTRKLDPTKELSHAMQQVRNYQSFCMRNYGYLSSEDKLDIFAPKAYVIIGNALSDSEKKTLDELNRSLSFLEVHTYEYLLTRAKSFIKTIKSL
jgi:hypothetical protein